MRDHDPPLRVLLLGGTGEAAALARLIETARPDVDLIYSLAGHTVPAGSDPGSRAPPPHAGRLRVGGFGGAEGLRRYLSEQGVDRLIDATHPFAARISANAALACREAGVPRLVLERPAWSSRPGDVWAEAMDMEHAAEVLPSLGRRAFLAVGSKEIAAFAETPVWCLVRLLSEPEGNAFAGPAQGLVITGRGPFSMEDELALLAEHHIDVVVTKASGGLATWAKVEAARLMRLPVLMVRRPAPPPGPSVMEPRAALEWLNDPEIGG